MHMTNFLEDKLLDHVLRNTAYTSPSILYVALCTADPGESGSTSSEISGGAYARQTATFATPNLGSCSSSLDIQYPQATSDWGTVSHIVMLDTATSGNSLFYGPFQASKTIVTNDIFRIPAGSLTVSTALHMTTYLRNKLLDHLLRNTPYASPTSLYIALCKADPGESGSTLNEITGGAYARQLVSFNAPNSGSCANSLDVQYPQATADWGTISHLVILDASTGGNPLFYGPLLAAKEILNGDVFKISSGSLSIKLD